MMISQCIRPAHAVLDLDAGSKTDLLKALAEKAGQHLNVASDDIFAALASRERVGSTGIGEGVAIPHAPVAGVTQPFGMVARLAEPIDFDAIDEMPVDIVCLVLTPPEKVATCLNLLSRIARQFRAPGVLDRARAARRPEELYAALTRDDH
ncbi:PTS sugar transporter subunit IIA [Mesorhizobium australicum]|uniref:PTS IIA-like nitrogen-regulatory protein PtsN n=1 Tax=Mesorhizobium australicum TaxID=536018 RepID=A0A1X7N512_9HYPH|nr:PTS sugar transporter subunit IIA [Mesorhizobium australicum]SMH32459.1 PTS IIA-like nitrogen-regulatory protein PtsN [Mesorhizobium australicum]